MNQFDFNLGLVLGHTLVFERSQPLRDDGVDPASIRNDMSPDIQARDVAAETEASLAATEKYSPRLGAIQRQQLEQTLLGSPNDGTRGLLDIYFKDAAPTAAAADRAASTAQREQDIADVGRLGADAVAAFRNANPEQKALMDALNASAMEGLSAGRNLPPGMRRQVEQNIRGAQGARGFGFGMNDAMSEALATTDAAERYYAGNFQRAQGMAGRGRLPARSLELQQLDDLLLAAVLQQVHELAVRLPHLHGGGGGDGASGVLLLLWW